MLSLCGWSYPVPVRGANADCSNIKQQQQQHRAERDVEQQHVGSAVGWGLLSEVVW